MNQNTDTVPTIEKTAFSCPHCNAYTTQTWNKVYLSGFSKEQRTPTIPTSQFIEDIENDKNMGPKLKVELLEWGNRMIAGKPFVEIQEKSSYLNLYLNNLNTSKCYNCKEISVWCHDQLVYPKTKMEILPNQDLPPHIRKLFEEAREIVSSSPRGAAALLRLCIQYLCKELGESGENINQDIKSLVSKGLNPLVQKALDIVRVIGNESVHPGEINLDDNRDTALKLFNLVNLIAEQMITHPNQVNTLYGSLPEGKRKGIEQRDKTA